MFSQDTPETGTFMCELGPIAANVIMAVRLINFLLTIEIVSVSRLLLG